MAKFYLKLSQLASDNGKHQVFVRVVINRTNKPSFRSGVYVLPDWLKEGEIKPPNKGKFNTAEIDEAKEAKNALDVYKSRLDKICQVTERPAPEMLNKKWIEDAERVVRKSNVKTEEITYNKIVELLEQDKKEDAQEAEAQALSFFDVWDRYIAQHQGTDRRKDHIKVMKRALQRFEIYSDEKFDVSTFSCDHLRAFRDFLRDEHTFFDTDPTTKKKSPKSRYKYIYDAIPETHIPKERSKNYIANFFKVLRAFFTWAVRNDYTANDPFRKFSVSKEIAKEIYGTPFYLTIAERNLLYNYDFGDNTKLATQRDIFVAQCCFGCRIGDMYRFTRSNIISKDGILYLSYVPRKTVDEAEGNLAEVPLNSIALEILAKYETHKGGRGRKRLFPFIAEQHYNEAIREMLKVAGIDRVVTILNPRTRKDEQHPLYEVASSHMARRTFINGLYQKVQDPNIIGSMSGHVSGSKAFSRYRKIEDKIKIDLINAVEADEENV